MIKPRYDNMRVQMCTADDQAIMIKPRYDKMWFQMCTAEVLNLNHQSPYISHSWCMILVSTEWKSFVSEKKQKTTNDGFWNSRGIIGEKSNYELWTMAIFSHRLTTFSRPLLAPCLLFLAASSPSLSSTSAAQSRRETLGRGRKVRLCNSMLLFWSIPPNM